MNRRFKMNLSSRSITETINQLKQLSSDVEKARKEVVKALVVRTGELIQENYNKTTEKPFNEDYVVKTIISEDGLSGSALAEGDSVLYAEFGTGEIGARGQKHPERGKFPLNDFNSGPMVSKLINKKGEHYWFYDGKYTQGIPAGLQVYNALQTINNEKLKIARNVVRDVIW